MAIGEVTGICRVCGEKFTIRKEKRQTPLRGMHKNNMIYVQHVIESKKLKKNMKKKIQNPLLLQ